MLIWLATGPSGMVMAALLSTVWAATGVPQFWGTPWLTRNRLPSKAMGNRTCTTERTRSTWK
jgi:hypothetical protein